MTAPQVGAWHVACVLPPDEKEGKPASINAIETLTDEQYEAHKEQVAFLGDYFSSCQLIDCVKLNVHEFLAAFAQYASDFCQTKQMDEDRSEAIMLNYSRLLLNVLSMFRSFLDHSDASLTREYGSASTELQSWKAKQVELYDSMFAYRFFYKIRNFAQHVGVPPLHIAFSSSASHDHVKLRVDLLRDELLKESDLWGATVRNDLLREPEHIPLMDLLDTWKQGFDDLSRFLLGLKLAKAKGAASFLLDYRERHSVPPAGRIAVLWLPTENPDPNRLNITLAWVPESRAQTVIKSCE